MPLRRRAIGIVLAALAIVACRTSSGGGDAGTAAAFIGPEGGVVQVGGVTLSVPQGALANSTNITVQVLDDGGAEVPGRVRVSQVYLILPDTLRFLTPATVKLTYDPTLVPAGVPATSNDVRHLDYSRAAPERLGSILVDTDAQTVSGETLGLGSFWATAPEGPRPVSVTVSPASATIYVTATQSFTATVYDQDGLTMADQTITWSSSMPTVAIVDGSGTATGVTAGTTQIVAQVGAAKGTATLQVASSAPFTQSFSWENPIPGASDLYRVRGSALAGLAVAGAHGTVAVRSQGAWTRLLSMPETVLRDLGPQGAGIVAVGESEGQGLLLQSDGKSVKQLVVPDTSLAALWIDGASGMAVGDGPNLAALDATGAWAVAPSPVSEPLLAVDGADGNAVVVGARGSVYELQSGAWVSLASAPLPEYQLAAVASGEEAWSISATTLRHFAAGQWSVVPLPAAPLLTLSAVTHTDSVLAVAGQDAGGTTWVLADDGTGFAASAPGKPVNGLGGTSATDLYAAGPQGAVLAFDGTSWTSQQQGVVADVAALAVFDGPQVFAAANVCADAACTAQQGLVLRRDGSGAFAQAAGPFDTVLSAIGGLSADDVWAAGEGSDAWHLSGGTWSKVSAPDASLTCLSPCKGVLYACGSMGLYSASSAGWGAAYGEIRGARALGCGGQAMFAVGDYAVWQIVEGQSSSLDSMDDLIYPAPWRAVYATPDGHAFIGGNARYLLHWTGQKFEAMDMPANLPILGTRALWGTGFGDVWAGGVLVSGDSFLVHFNGAFWQAVDPGLDGALAAIGGLAGGDVWIGGPAGALLHGAPPSP